MHTASLFQLWAPLTPPTSPCCCCMGWGCRESALALRSPPQRTTGSCCTTGTMTTSQWSCTRATYVSATTLAATPALPSTGRASSCPPATLTGPWAESRSLLGPPDAGLRKGTGIRTLEDSPAVPEALWDLSSGPIVPRSTSQGAPEWGGEADSVENLCPKLLSFPQGSRRD